MKPPAAPPIPGPSNNSKSALAISGRAPKGSMMFLGDGVRAVEALRRLGGKSAAEMKLRIESLAPAKVDAIWLSAAGVAVMVIEYYSDLAPLFFQFALQHEDWEIDNLIFAIFTLSVGFLYFGYRRVRELRDEIMARRGAELAASTLARHDALTGLPNRRFFVEMLEGVLAATSTEAPSAVLIMDLDGFKSINDGFGHAAGDACLVEFTQRVSAVMRGGSKLIRIGGDEFAVVVPDARAPNDPAALARRIVAEVEKPFAVGEVSASIGVGVGIAVAPADGADPDTLVQRADRALYRAKAEGRSRIRFFEPEMDAHVDRRIALETELRAAIVAGDIVPFYQPIVSLKDGRIVGFEALARWRNAKGEWTAPDLFIPMAEELGLIAELGDQLLRRACRDALAWPSELTLAFNVSAKQMCDPGVGLRLLAILAEMNFSPRRLEVEITETAAVDNIKTVQTVTEQLRQAGVRIALDDFGTGYSTFAQLLALKPDRIKIDRSFVDKLGVDRGRDTIVRALIGLAGGLELATTAEGIENDRQLAALNADGCLEGQGYLFSKAVAADEVAALIGRREFRRPAA